MENRNLIYRFLDNIFSWMKLRTFLMGLIFFKVFLLIFILFSFFYVWCVRKFINSDFYIEINEFVKINLCKKKKINKQTDFKLS